MAKHGLKIEWRPLMVVMLSVFIWLTVQAFAQEPQDVLIREQAEVLDTDQVEKYWDRLLQEYGGYFPESQMPSMMEMILPGGEGIHFGQVVSGLFRFLFYEVLYNGSLLVSIIILTVFSMMLETMQSAFEHHTVSKIA